MGQAAATAHRLHRLRHVPLVAVVIVLASATAAAAPEADADSLRVIYLANEGFLLRTGRAAILIDALFGTGLRGYGVLDEGERQKLESAQAPYDSVDLVVASHFHRDHFDAAAVARFLHASPETRFVSTEHAVRDLLRADSGLESRAQGLYPAEGRQKQITVGDLQLTLFNLHHGRDRPETQNLGLLIETCGTTVLHIGDTEANLEDLRDAGLQDLAPDLALLPSWYLRPGRWMAAAQQVIRPQRVAAMHLPTDDAPRGYFWGDLDTLEKLVGAIETRFPGAFVPVATGESVSLTCRQPD